MSTSQIGYTESNTEIIEMDTATCVLTMKYFREQWDKIIKNQIQAIRRNNKIKNMTSCNLACLQISYAHHSSWRWTPSFLLIFKSRKPITNLWRIINCTCIIIYTTQLVMTNPMACLNNRTPSPNKSHSVKSPAWMHVNINKHTHQCK